MRGAGSLLPGYARKFTFKYSSREVGTHLEKWICRIYPRLEKPVEIVDLKGVTMFEDRLRFGQTSTLSSAKENFQVFSLQID
ncbi:hypothetical protein Mapa_017327 [Marchantia paleacea]|nr:hypothetical protein Mapa_017327 [Marchantia paleacea]